MPRRLLLFVYPTLRDVTTLLGINDAFAWCCDDKFTGANFRLDAPLSLSQPGMYRCVHSKSVRATIKFFKEKASVIDGRLIDY